MATIKRPGTKSVKKPIQEECPQIPNMTEEEVKASRLAYERCKPKLEAALGKLNVTVKGVIGVRKA